MERVGRIIGRPPFDLFGLVKLERSHWIYILCEVLMFETYYG